MKLIEKKGTTSKIVHLFIQDSSVTTGAGLTGLVYNSAGLKAYYIRPGDSSATAITLASATIGTYASGGFVEVDSTNMPGIYEFGIPNACLASGANQCVIMLQGATNMAPVSLEIQLVDYDPYSATNLGLTNLDALISSRSSHSASDVWSSATRTITGGSIDTNNDKTGYQIQGTKTTLDALNDLSQQNVRDAMKLAPTAGSPDSGSVDDHLDSLDVTKLTTARANNLDNLDVASSTLSTFDPTVDNVQLDLTQTVSSYTGDPGTVGQLLYTIKQWAKNKLSFNKSTSQMTLYEDDGTTAKWTYTMTDNSSEATRGGGA